MRRPRSSAFFIFALACTLGAQDVTVTRLAWIDPQDVGGELPIQSGFVLPEFPTELKKTSQIGWAEVDSFIDEQGMLGLREVHATLSFYEDVARAALAKTSYKPARRGGKPVAARVRQVILFNPRTSGTDRADATPRLLGATTIVDSSRVAGGGAAYESAEVMWVIAGVDAAGRAKVVSGVSPQLEELVNAALYAWRFAPARQANAPVAAELRLPVIFSAPGTFQTKGLVPARPLRRIPPVYPFRAREAGESGTVLLEFTVDREGKPQGVSAVYASSEAFAVAAEEALRGWTFTPARLDGKPISWRQQQQIGFSIEDGSADAGIGVKVRGSGDASKLPEAVHYDTAPKLRRIVQPKYPYPLLNDGVKGSARIAIVLNPQGGVTASKVVRCDRPEFGYALQAAVEKFQYRPALKDGDPTSTILTVEETFEPSPAESVIVSARERNAFQLERKHPERVSKPGELDAKLKPFYTPPPIYPRSLTESVPGDAVVEFLVDATGTVVLPRIISASRPEFGYAAVQAVAEWQFEPPTNKGKPALVRVRAPVAFQPKP